MARSTTRSGAAISRFSKKSSRIWSATAFLAGPGILAQGRDDLLSDQLQSLQLNKAEFSLSGEFKVFEHLTHLNLI